MLRLRLKSFGSLVGAFLIASCATAGLQDATGPDTTGSDGALNSPPSEMHALWWSNEYQSQISVSKAVDQSGGTISIPETGFTMDIPAGALTGPLTITVTADTRYVAYKMEPTGTQFAKDVTVTQSLTNTTIAGQTLSNQLYAAYIADDSVSLSGKVPVAEIEPSTTIFSSTNSRVPVAQVWIIRHFSRYMLASG
jgi:hypothetical protein